MKGVLHFVVMFNSLYSKLSVQILIKSCVAIGLNKVNLLQPNFLLRFIKIFRYHTVKQNEWAEMAPHPYLSTARLSSASPPQWGGYDREFQMACHHVNTGSHQRVSLPCSFFPVSLEPEKPCTITNCHTRAFRETHLAITFKLACSSPNSFNYSHNWHGIYLGFLWLQIQCHRYGGNRTLVHYETSRSHPGHVQIFRHKYSYKQPAGQAWPAVSSSQRASQ